MCHCLAKANRALAPRNLALKTRHTINLKTGKYSEDLALETVALKRGVRATPVRLAFCPFCGKSKA